MPIYAYRCAVCGHAKDVLRKISDPVLSVCPACGAAAFQKQVTAAGFQLKGSGWYVTDFRGDGKGGKEAKESKDGKGDRPSSTAEVPAGGKEPSAPAASAPAASGSAESAASASTVKPSASATPGGTSGAGSGGAS
ncbi:MAG: FmdB family zinc ribbon protein, partial [Burkholderiaceae bacterium]